MLPRGERIEQPATDLVEFMSSLIEAEGKAAVICHIVN